MLWWSSVAGQLHKCINCKQKRRKWTHTLSKQIPWKLHLQGRFDTHYCRSLQIGVFIINKFKTENSKTCVSISPMVHGFTLIFTLIKLILMVSNNSECNSYRFVTFNRFYCFRLVYCSIFPIAPINNRKLLSGRGNVYLVTFNSLKTILFTRLDDFL